MWIGVIAVSVVLIVLLIAMIVSAIRQIDAGGRR